LKTLAFALLFLGACAALLISCGGGPLAAHTDGLDPAILPTTVQASYTVFSDRCSKCHSLARALNSGIESNEYWDRYVERMRRQPGSGISVDDTHVILQFLYYYAAVQRKRSSSRASPSPYGDSLGRPTVASSSGRRRQIE
jgi:hypothetical protein